MVQVKNSGHSSLTKEFPGLWIFRFRSEHDVKPGGIIYISCFSNIFRHDSTSVRYLPFIFNEREVHVYFE